jgi:hypothetical protein
MLDRVSNARRLRGGKGIREMRQEMQITRVKSESVMQATGE